MKKLYFLFIFCLTNFASFAITVTVNVTGATGSYKTGYTQASTGRTDGDMVIDAAGTIKRGYAVFNLAGVVPTGATVTAVSIRFNFTTTTLGLGVACGIRGFAGDLSTVSTTATLFADCFSGTAFNTTNWGASTTGTQDLLPFNPTGNTFIQTNAGMLVSICFATTAGANVYTITGEGGTTLTQPQLQITYNCTGVSGVSATATPNPVCNGSTLTLTGAGTGTTSYVWSGPSSFSASTVSTSLTASPTSVGIYTLTAYNAGGCGTNATTAPVTISAAVPAITGTTTLCASGGTAALSDGTTGGTWSAVSGTIATVGSTSGVVTGVIPGTATVTYITPAGCNTNTIVTVNALPPAIAGVTNLCVGSSASFTDPSPGVWSSSNTIQAVVGAGSGIVTGLSGGTPTISFTYGGCSSTWPVSINPAPLPITGTAIACPGSTTTLADAAGGGVWSSSVVSVATINSATGVVTGIVPGSTIVTYSNGCGPAATATLIVSTLPRPINGLTAICLGSTTTLSDSSMFGTWSAAPAGGATVGSASGVVTGTSVGTSVITYTLPTTCSVTLTVTVNTPPAPITGANSVCTGQTTSLAETVTGGVWSSSDLSLATVGATGIVSGISFGPVSITYTAGVSCYLVHTMTVNPLAPVLGTDSVCLGMNTFLTNIVGGGTWSSSAPLVASVTLDSGKVSGRAPGTVIITYLLPTGCRSSANVSVITFPNAITGNGTMCPGTTTSLSDVTAGGVWSSQNNGVATVAPASGVVTGIYADTVSINYSILPGCVVNMQVTVNPLPALITGANRICPQTTDSLNDLSLGGLWSSGTLSLATVIDTSGVVTSIAQGSAVIKYTLPTGCFRTKTIFIDPLPVPVINYNWLSGTFYVDTISDYLSYQWYDSLQGKIVGATSPSLAALYTEYYFVVVTDTNGCKGASALYHYNVVELGAGSTINNSNIKIYPNPAAGSLYIESQVNVRAVITGMDGKTELEMENAKEIDISHLSDAMYFISLFDDSGRKLTTQKLIKE